MEFARRHFPGHQVIVCTHTDGHNKAGNIHVHIVFNSLRKLDVEREPFMERPADALAGFKHHVSKDFMEYLKQETMEMCQRESFYQVDLLSPAKVRITDREYWAQRRGQAALDAENQKKIVAGITPTATKYETQLGMPDNFLIQADNGIVTSSLRFNYMFPIPKAMVSERVISSEPDAAYRALLSQELRFCIKHQAEIQKLAERTYKRVLLGKDPGLVENSCAFTFLEGKCKAWVKEHTPEK